MPTSQAGPVRPPATPTLKRSASASLREWRNFRAQYGSDPVETPGSAGYALALRIRKARGRAGRAGFSDPGPWRSF